MAVKDIAIIANRALGYLTSASGVERHPTGVP